MPQKARLLNNLLGHGLWMENDTSEKTFRKHPIKIAYLSRDDQSKKLADGYLYAKELELYLTMPDRRKFKRAAVAGDDHFNSDFTHHEDGVYMSSISKASKETGNSTIYEFRASAIVKADKLPAGNDQLSMVFKSRFSLMLQKLAETNQPWYLTRLFEDNPSEKPHVDLASSNAGNMLINSDKNRMASFTLSGLVPTKSKPLQVKTPKGNIWANLVSRSAGAIRFW